MVRPWKERSATTTRVRPVRRVSLKAASLASAPELQKNTRPPRSPDGSSRLTSRSASAMAGSVMARLLVWPIVDACAVMAATTSGCA